MREDPDDAEITIVPANLVWEETLTLPGPDDEQLRSLYPRINVTAGDPYYIEFGNDTGDGEWSIFRHWGPIDEYPARSRKAAAIMLMIQNNLDPSVAQFPYELVTYGGNVSCQLAGK